MSTHFSADHHDRRVGVAADDAREHGRVRDAQRLHAVHAKLRIHDRIRIGAHAAGAARMMHGRSAAPDVIRQAPLLSARMGPAAPRRLGIARTGSNATIRRASCRPRNSGPTSAGSLSRFASMIGYASGSALASRRCPRLLGYSPTMLTAIAVPQRKRERVLVPACRLEHHLDVGRSSSAACARRRCTLEDVARQRPGPEQRVLDEIRHASRQRAQRDAVRLGVRHLEDQRGGEMVVIVRADARQVMLHLDAVGFERGAIADAGKHEDLRRLDSHTDFAAHERRRHAVRRHRGDARACGAAGWPRLWHPRYYRPASPGARVGQNIARRSRGRSR